MCHVANVELRIVRYVRQSWMIVCSAFWAIIIVNVRKVVFSIWGKTPLKVSCSLDRHGLLPVLSDVHNAVLSHKIIASTVQNAAKDISSTIPNAHNARQAADNALQETFAPNATWDIVYNRQSHHWKALNVSHVLHPTAFNAHKISFLV